MSSGTRPGRVATPWHLWVVAGFFLLLYAIGAYDYVQVLLENDSYFDAQGYGPEQVEYFTDYPRLPLFFWTANVASGLAVVVLLVLRSRWAVLAAATATQAQVYLQIITFGFMDRWNVLGVRLAVTDIVVLLLTAAVWLYGRRMRRANVLT
ncbi:hypothetical protein CLV30_11683 [Haloactinopolyspora alba]|uniref:Sugar transporter n=2 Tax=Haloactinopolyspora alba TaxID=648780 RepID=A0A2P8DT80_9ACTN|nr:hypothetical protein [Haloactinopolyspora alba]PSL00423.1 hypothetical protein CLV30_11683 [Haloactinopolyspora alba]